MLSKIQHQLASLSTAECKVARLILEQPSDAARSAVGDIARLAQVDAAARAPRKRQIACNRANQGAERVQGLPAVWAGVIQGMCADLRGGPVLGRCARLAERGGRKGVVEGKRVAV